LQIYKSIDIAIQIDCFKSPQIVCNTFLPGTGAGEEGSWLAGAHGEIITKENYSKNVNVL
jgi:hypothetical protein